MAAAAVAAEGEGAAGTSAKAACAAAGHNVVPGDVVQAVPNKASVLRIGAGLMQMGDHIVATKAGVVRQTKQGKLWIEGRQKRYIPTLEDCVIGVVNERYGENYAVDVGGPFIASLPGLSFEGATRRNRPNLQARARWCTAVLWRAAETRTRNSPVRMPAGKPQGSGRYRAATASTLPARSLASELLSKPAAPVLEALEKASIKFEIAIGVNGRVWVKTGSPASTVLVSNAILQSEFLSQAQCQILVKKLLQDSR
eukprot:jgi/Chlat1/6172/Chrsp41S05715